MHFLNEETQFEFNPKTQIWNLRPFTSTPTRLAFITWPNIVIYYHLGISFAIVLTQNLHRLRMKPFMEIDASTITQIKSARGTKIHAKMEGNAGIMFCLHIWLKLNLLQIRHHGTHYDTNSQSCFQATSYLNFEIIFLWFFQTKWV